MSDLVLWEASRAAALGAFLVLCAVLLSGMALRTQLLAPLARNRAVLEVHGFLTWFWVPLLAVHLVALLLDATARLRLLDLVVPFQVPYGRLAVGLGTVGLLLAVLVVVSAVLRHHLSPRLWRWLHRLAYPMVALVVVHAQLAGSDVGGTVVGVVGWGVVGALAILFAVRLLGGRVEGEPTG